MSTQSQKLEFFEKKLSLGVRSPCLTSTVSKVELFIFYLATSNYPQPSSYN